MSRPSDERIDKQLGTVLDSAPGSQDWKLCLETARWTQSVSYVLTMSIPRLIRRVCTDMGGPWMESDSSTFRLNGRPRVMLSCRTALGIRGFMCPSCGTVVF